MENTVLIKNATVVTAVDKYQADIFIEDEKVKVIGKNLDYPANKIIDAKGKYVFPGGVDPYGYAVFGQVTDDSFETVKKIVKDFKPSFPGSDRPANPVRIHSISLQ